MTEMKRGNNRNNKYPVDNNKKLVFNIPLDLVLLIKYPNPQYIMPNIVKIMYRINARLGIIIPTMIKSFPLVTGYWIATALFGSMNNNNSNITHRIATRDKMYLLFFDTRSSDPI